MKIISDYVTNSSSANFILARRGKLSEKQIKNLVKCIESEYLGKIVLKHNATEKEIKDFFNDNYISDDQEEAIRNELKEGKDIYEGYVSFEEAEYNIADMYDKIWSALDGEDNITFIKGDLDY